MDDDTKFSEWWMKIEPELLGSMERMVPLDAQDIVQDVSILAVMKFAEFESLPDFRRWCYKRSNWMALDAIGRRKRFKLESERLIEGMLAPEVDENLAFLADLLKRLPETQREVTVARIHGFTSDEIASRFGITQASVRSNWRHAKHNLIRYFEDEMQ